MFGAVAEVSVSSVLLLLLVPVVVLVAGAVVVLGLAVVVATVDSGGWVLPWLTVGGTSTVKTSIVAVEI